MTRNSTRMLTLALIGVVAGLLGGCGGGRVLQSRRVQATEALQWTAELSCVVDGLAMPMCVEIDAEGNAYVSNLVSGEFWQDTGAAFISRIQDGQLVQPQWRNSTPAVPISAPKGMCILGDSLYVADNTRLLRLPLGQEQRGEWIDVPNAKGLVDVTTDGRALYISDGASDPPCIYRLDPATGRTVSIPAPGRASGIVIASGNMMAASSYQHDLCQVDPTGQTAPVPFDMADQFAHLSSLAVLRDGTLVVADFEANKLFTVDPVGQVRVLIDEVQSPTMIAYDSKRDLLYVPMLQANQVAIYQLSTFSIAPPVPANEPAVAEPSPAAEADPFPTEVEGEHPAATH